MLEGSSILGQLEHPNGAFEGSKVLGLEHPSSSTLKIVHRVFEKTSSFSHGVLSGALEEVVDLPS
jgi:hypothetical protein